MPMLPNCSFIHAADLHLGAPFKGLGQGLARRAGFSPEDCSEFPFTALARLRDLCLAARPDFLVLAGDVYHSRDGVLRAHLALRDFFLILNDAGIRVFLAHGNHDPLAAESGPVRWPDNVTVFGASWESHVVRRGGEALAVVDGISHAGRNVKDNLAADYRPGLSEADGKLFRVAVLHCAVGSASDGHEPYAPCTLGDLIRHSVDYWALGHVHGHQVLSRQPWVVYPGSLQGLHINEDGEHGCSLIRVDSGAVSYRFVSLAPVRWLRVHVDVDGEMSSLDDLENILADKLEALALEQESRQDTRLFCRLAVGGRTALDPVLRENGASAALADRLQALVADRGLAGFCLQDIRIRTRPDNGLDLPSGLAGEVAAQAACLLDDPAALDAFCRSHLADFYGHRSVRRLADLPPEDELRELVAEARDLATGMLEGV